MSCLYKPRCWYGLQLECITAVQHNNVLMYTDDIVDDIIISVLLIFRI